MNANLIKDYGALVVSGLAATLAALNLIVTWKAKRNEWLRTERISRYAGLAGAAVAFSKVVVKTLGPPTAGMSPLGWWVFGRSTVE